MIHVQSFLKDKQKVLQAYAKDPVPRYDVRSVKITLDPTLDRSFSDCL